MPNSIKYIIACGSLAVVIALTGACSPHRTPPMSISDLMEDRVELDGVLMKCNREPTRARTDADCQNARIAIERLAAQNDNQPAREAQRQEEFERTREQLRLQQEKQRLEREAKTKVDVYQMPVVPVESPPKDPQPPVLGQTSP
jgi:hypothetical protein